jgi:RHS repeat-associated protein
VKDALGGTLQLAYAPKGFLSSITDANGNVTTLVRDAEERIVGRKYADGTSTTLAYEQTTSRLLSITDALGQTRINSYNQDDTLAGFTYTGAKSPTASVSFTYDPVYRRRTSMTDGSGTTTYTYYPLTPPAAGAGRLQSVKSPVLGSKGVTDTVSYTYDLLGRRTGRTVAGAMETWTYDGLSRVTNVTNALDAFTYAFADSTARIMGVTSANGPASAMTYFGPMADDRLEQATFTQGSTQLSQFGYAYDAKGDVSSFTQKYVGQKLAGGSAGAAPPPPTERLPPLPIAPKTRLAPSDDGRRWGVPLAAGLVLLAFAFVSRRVGKGRRRLAGLAAPAVAALVVASCGSNGGSPGGSSSGSPGGSSGSGGQNDGGSGSATAQVTKYAYDGADRLVSAAVGTDVSTPSAPQYAYAYDPGFNVTSIAANGPAQTFSYTKTNAIASGTYDGNGSPTALGSKTYVWDAQNRLVSVTSGGKETDFSYDGDGHIVRIVQKQGSTTTSDKAYTWCGNTRCAEHDNAQSGSPLSTRYFDQGIVSGSTGYYYVAEDSGTVRQLVDTSGKVRAQYDYDPYGNRSKISGDLDSDIGYAGYFHEAASGLELTVHRAYDPAHARWVNRDPIGEAGGINLYAYAGDNPINYADPMGTNDRYTWCGGSDGFFCKRLTNFACKEAPSACCESENEGCYADMKTGCDGEVLQEELDKCNAQLQKCISGIKGG